MSNVASSVRAGVVSLVGAGPGSPDLLTLRAYRLLSRAAVVAHDELVPDAILALAPPHAEVFSVGRRVGSGRRPELPDPRVVARAFAGLDVVRLKGGDPMVFGRGGEEAQALEALGISVEVIPGITAALAAASQAKIPLTHREVARSVTLATACTADGEPAEVPPFSPRQTLALYMSVRSLEETVHSLLARQWPPSTPAAIVSRASLPGASLLRATLETIVAQVSRAVIEAPSILLVGESLALASSTVAIEKLDLSLDRAAE